MTSPYAVPLDALEDEARVPYEDQVESEPETRPRAQVDPWEAERRLIGYGLG